MPASCIACSSFAQLAAPWTTQHSFIPETLDLFSTQLLQLDYDIAYQLIIVVGSFSPNPRPSHGSWWVLDIYRFLEGRRWNVQLAADREGTESILLWQRWFRHRNVSSHRRLFGLHVTESNNAVIGQRLLVQIPVNMASSRVDYPRNIDTSLNRWHCLRSWLHRLGHLRRPLRTSRQEKWKKGKRTQIIMAVVANFLNKVRSQHAYFSKLLHPTWNSEH